MKFHHFQGSQLFLVFWGVKSAFPPRGTETSILPKEFHRYLGVPHGPKVQNHGKIMKLHDILGIIVIFMMFHHFQQKSWFSWEFAFWGERWPPRPIEFLRNYWCFRGRARKLAFLLKFQHFHAKTWFSGSIRWQVKISHGRCLSLKMERRYPV